MHLFIPTRLCGLPFIHTPCNFLNMLGYFLTLGVFMCLTVWNALFFCLATVYSLGLTGIIILRLTNTMGLGEFLPGLQKPHNYLSISLQFEGRTVHDLCLYLSGTKWVLSSDY